MFSYVSPEQCIPKDHPLRAIRALVDAVLSDLSRDFERLYALTAQQSKRSVVAALQRRLLR